MASPLIMSNLLILTVGTGTAGRESNLAQGLINTLQQVNPRRYWLVPSSSPDSTGLAELVRDGHEPKESFQPWSPTSSFRCIASPDDIFDCQAALREVVVAAKRELRPGEKLLLNPTSGTKQMSAGATLAAVAEEIGHLVFTVGDRQDGVVRTGTERMAEFSTEALFWERDLRIAEELFQHGAFMAAAQLLANYGEKLSLRPRQTALCLHEWQRMNYASAARHAARFSDDLRRYLEGLQKSDAFGEAALGDLLAGADELLRWGDQEEAMARYYRGAEQAAKVQLATRYGLRGPYYHADALEQGLPPGRWLDGLLASGRNGKVTLGLETAWTALQQLNDAMAADYWRDETLRSLLGKRNDTLYGHGLASLSGQDVKAARHCLQRLLEPHLRGVLLGWTTANRPTSLK